jgi:glutaminyl-tRNA synthetase
MNTGEIAEGAMVLRAKIDMASPNMHFRDPIMYRIITAHPHHRTGTTWKAYPMYDYAHGQSDYFEGVTHSLCTLEFVVHRPLYDWFIDQFADSDYRPTQTEFNRLNITYTVMSKRKMLQLVQEGIVAGWDDPRMPTICGLRRRGYTPESIQEFINRIGYTKVEGTIDVGLLEHVCREDLKIKTPRVCAILNPIKLIINNYPEGKTEQLTIENNPDNETLGQREMTFGKELFIEKDDFMENAPKSFFRLSEGREVRLKGAYIVLCTGCKKDENGNIIEVYCDYLPDTKSGMPGSNRKVKSTINWVEVNSCIDAEVRLYDRLFSTENPGSYDGDFHDLLNPDSLKIITGCKVESALQSAKPMDKFQFQKQGYFCVDKDSSSNKLIFNRTVSLKDNWAKAK